MHSRYFLAEVGSSSFPGAQCSAAVLCDFTMIQFEAPKVVIDLGGGVVWRPRVKKVGDQQAVVLHAGEQPDRAGPQRCGQVLDGWEQCL